MFHGETAFGNTPDAKALAEQHSRVMTSLSKVVFTGGPKGGLSLSDDKFLTYCERRPGRICFLVHVPALRSYHGEARDALLKIAWVAAKQVTRKRARPRISSSRSGAGERSPTAPPRWGWGRGAPVNHVAEVLDEKPLYEFFLEPGVASAGP
jgi:hypothetical protein